MNILIVSATTFEIAPLIQYLDKHAEKPSFFEYKLNGHQIYPLVTGVGALNTSFALARYSGIKETTVAINVGLAGSFDRSVELGSVLEVNRDRFADLGVEEADGHFTDVYDLELEQKDNFPFKDGWLINEKPVYQTGLQMATALTVNKVTGTKDSIIEIQKKYIADLESMEGAGFMYACSIMDVDYHQFRAVSNYVEPRNKANWKIDLAIDNLNKELIAFLNSLTSTNT